MRGKGSGFYFVMHTMYFSKRDFITETFCVNAVYFFEVG